MAKKNQRRRTKKKVPAPLFYFYVIYFPPLFFSLSLIIISKTQTLKITNEPHKHIIIESKVKTRKEGHLQQVRESSKKMREDFEYMDDEGGLLFDFCSHLDEVCVCSDLI